MIPFRRAPNSLLRHRLPTPILTTAAAPLGRRASTFPVDPISSDHVIPTARTTVSEEDKKRICGYLYFDSVFPIRFGIWDLRYYFLQAEKTALLEQLRSLVPADSAYSTRVESVVSRAKDGGAFVQFSFIPPSAPYASSDEPLSEGEKEKVLKLVETEARDAISARDYKPWFTWGASRCFLVRGKPWLDDMNRFVNRSIRIEFEGPEIPQEELYELFRPYGKIHNIFPQPSSNKDVPKFATISYTSIRSAASARNCLHASTVSSILPDSNTPTVLRILYSESQKSHYVRDWITNHPRIVLPIVVALVGGLSYAIFDPIRKFFVKAKIDGAWDSRSWKFVGWLKKETLGRLGLTSSATVTASTGIEKEREEARNLLEGWLKDYPDTFIIVSGPRGSGKTALVDGITAESKNVLTIDCAAICKNARTDTKLVSELASAVGYWPQFVLAASLNNMIDLASVGLIGQKAGFSATLDAQLKSILEVTSSALKSLATETNSRTARAAARAEALRESAGMRESLLSQLKSDGVRDGRVDAVSGNGMMSELGMGIERGCEESHVVIYGPKSSSMVRSLVEPEHDPNCPNEATNGLPVVVVKGFAAKGEAKQEVLWDVLAEWAAVLVENQVAHVIFTSDSVTVSKPLAKALPNKPFSTISLNDASPDAALQYVESKLAQLNLTLSSESDSNPDKPTPFLLSEESRPWVSKLGGRQTDLELLVQKIKAGLSAQDAVQDIVERSATELRKNFFGDDIEEAKSLKWTREQAWKIVKGMTEEDELKYADVLVNAPFKSDETALRALENAEMISIHHVDGRPSSIRPGKPVYLSAFRLLLADPVFSATISFQINASATASATSDLEAASKSLIDLSQLFGGGTGSGQWAFGGGNRVPIEVQRRVEGLLGKMKEAEDKLEKLDAEKKELLKVLKEES